MQNKFFMNVQVQIHELPYNAERKSHVCFLIKPAFSYFFDALRKFLFFEILNIRVQSLVFPILYYHMRNAFPLQNSLQIAEKLLKDSLRTVVGTNVFEKHGLEHYLEKTMTASTKTK